MIYNIQKKIGSIKANNVTSDQANRVLSTRTVEGLGRPNGYIKGFRQVERFRVKITRTTEG